MAIDDSFGPFLQGLYKLVEKDTVYIIMIILVLGASIYTIYHVRDYVEDCNNHWKEQLKGYVCYPIDKAPVMDPLLINKTWVVYNVSKN